MAQRLGAMERLLSSYREKQVEVRRPDGTFQTITVLAKEGGEASGSTFGTTIQIKTLEKVQGRWRVRFFPAKLAEHSILHAGETHSIQVPGGNLDNDPTPFINIAPGDKVWLTFKVTQTADVDGDSVKLVIGNKMPERVSMNPIRPGNEEGKVGDHVQEVGSFSKDGDALIWLPNNTNAVFCGFFTAIESVGDGEKLYDSYTDNPPTDRYRSIRGQTDDELDTDGWKKIDEDFPADSGFEIREFPLKIELEVVNQTLLIKGKAKVPIPNGMEGDYEWQHCETEGDDQIKASVKRGIILNSLSNAGVFIAAGCDRSSDMPGP
jgi:hypothetical protein